MIKMLIKMNDDKLSIEENLSARAYTALDRIFTTKGMERLDTDEGIEYIGHEKSTDFAQFAKIMIGLKNQKWFMDNVDKWLYLCSDDSDSPDDYNVEDLLEHYKEAISM